MASYPDCCRRLSEALGNDEWPLVYDVHVQEVGLRLGAHEGIAVVRFCPFCGGKLESGRGRLFVKPTPDEMENVRSRLTGLTSLDEVIERLGPPDDEGTGCGLQTTPWTRWVRYSSIWKSLVLTVGECEQGGLSWAYGGQPRSELLSEAEE